jgi:putative intracellular protease/amidase
MRRRTLIIGVGAAAVAAGAPILLAARKEPSASPAPQRVPASEHEQSVEALTPPKRPRPAIALLALNAGTEVSDFLTAYGVLAESGVADMRVVAERAGPIRLYPSARAETQWTFAQFDAAYPDGADYVVVPAMDPANDPGIIAWIKAQHAKGAKIVSICNGSLTMSAAGLLDGRKATGHWYSIDKLRAAHPTMQWVPDRRYVVDREIATSTGVTASIPLMLALVEAIGGRAEAEKLAARIGVADWDARHNSAAFKLDIEHRKTFVRNKLSFWRHEVTGIKIDGDVDEIALGLMADAHARTELVRVVTVGGDAPHVTSRHGLRLLPDVSARSAASHVVLEPPRERPARTIDRELARIAQRYDRPTAALVALQMEYPWPVRGAELAQRPHAD